MPKRIGWRGVAGLIAVVDVAIYALRTIFRAIRTGGDVDFVVERSKDPGWVGWLMEHFISPSPWTLLALLAAGLLLIWWDVRRARQAPAPELALATSITPPDRGDFFAREPEPQTRTLGPGERERLGNLYFEISQFVTEGQNIVWDTQRLFERINDASMAEQREKLGALINRTQSLHDRMFNEFTHKNNYYQREIYEVVAGNGALTAYRMFVSEYLALFDCIEEAGLSDEKLTRFMRCISKNQISRGRHSLEEWVGESNKRLSRKRAEIQ